MSNEQPRNRRHKLVNGERVELTDEEERERDIEEATWEAEAPQREEARQRQIAEAEAFRSSLKYETRIVAFVDILGWSEAVKSACNNDELVQSLGIGLHFISKLVEMWHFSNSDGSFPGDARITQFSDNVVVSAASDLAGKSILESILTSLTHSLLQGPFLVRGGVTVGEIYHQKSVVFGPAMITAYELESKKASSPRIILDQAVNWSHGLEVIDRDQKRIGNANAWRLDADGHYFFDFLQPFPGSPVSFDNLIPLHLAPWRELIIQRLEKYKDDARIFPKYEWLATYYNTVCEEHPELGIPSIAINEGPDFLKWIP